MGAKIKLRVDRQAFDSVATFTRYAADNIHVSDEATLVAKEYLTELAWKLQGRREKGEGRKQLAVSMSFLLAILFDKQVLGVMQLAGGDYERALSNILHAEIEKQISRAIQERMFQ